MVQHRLADDHIPDADLAGHVARNAREDDLLRAELGDEHLRGSGGVGLAHTGAAHHHLLAGQRTLVVLHAAVGLNGDIFQLCTQLVYFIGHSAHNTQDHGKLLLRSKMAAACALAIFRGMILFNSGTRTACGRFGFHFSREGL